jgi:hypothetical protein
MSTRDNKREIRDNREVAQKLDPGWVRRDRLERAGMAIVGILAMGAIVVATVSIVMSSGTRGEVHRFIQKTPCATRPAGHKCTHVKERIARKGSLRNPCIEHQRVTGTRGANCPRFYIPPVERETGHPPASSPMSAAPGAKEPSREVGSSAVVDKESAENLTPPPPVGGVAPPAKSTPAGKPDESGPVATAPTPPPAPSPKIESPSGTGEATAPSTNPPVEIEAPAAPSEEAAPKALGQATGELVEGTVDEVGGDVGGLVEGTCERTEALLRLC